MSTENNEAALIDGGTPTDEEARLAAQLDGLGDNPQEEPAPVLSAEEQAAAEKAAADAAAAEAEKVAAEAAAAAQAAAPAPAAEVPAAPPAPAPDPKPEAPKDFNAEYAAIQKQFDDGDIDGGEFQKRNRELNSEENRFNTRVMIWEERQTTAANAAQETFNKAAFAWEAENAEFMKNPLRRNQMQIALQSVEASDPHMAPADQIAKAADIAFEAFNWQRAAAPAPVDPAQAVKDAVAARAPKPVPQTLGGAPQAAPIEANANAAFTDLDNRDISSLEDALARMSPEMQEAYLRDAPGANTTGRPE